MSDNSQGSWHLVPRGIKPSEFRAGTGTLVINGKIEQSNAPKAQLAAELGQRSVIFDRVWVPAQP